MQKFLPYGRQLIEDDDIAAVSAVLRSDMLTTGPKIPEFENAFAAAVRARHALACSNGTAALHLVAAALDLGPGVAAVVPSITFLATANAVRLTGAEVVFADVDTCTGLITAATIKAAMARSRWPVKAIFVVHLGGQTCDMLSLEALARETGAALIEDACHALGTVYEADGKRHTVGACRHSTAATFSLHPVKTIAAGEGGVVTTADDGLASRLALLRNHGMSREPPFASPLATGPSGSINPWYYEMPEPGFNYRLSDIQAALALSQLNKLDRFAAQRRMLAQRYEETLGQVQWLAPTGRSPGCAPVWHLFQVLCDFPRLGLDRAAVMARLRQQGIGTQVHYIPVHRQPYYAQRYPNTSLHGADQFYDQTLSLPLFAGMTIADVDRVVSALAAIESNGA